MVGTAKIYAQFSCLMICSVLSGSKASKGCSVIFADNRAGGDARPGDMEKWQGETIARAVRMLVHRSDRVAICKALVTL